MGRNLKELPIPVCGSSNDSDDSVSFCVPASVNDFQLCTIKSCNLCAYHKIDGKLVKLSQITAPVAYLYISPNDTEKLNKKDKVKLYTAGVRKLHIHKQYVGKLRCEYVGTKSIKSHKIKSRNLETNWIWWIVLFFIVIIFGYLTYYSGMCKSTNFTNCIRRGSEDPIFW